LEQAEEITEERMLIAALFQMVTSGSHRPWLIDYLG
jgi:hypothetical protein